MKPFLCTLLFFSFNHSFAQSISAGPRDASSFSNNTALGTFAWVNTTNAITNDNSFAGAGLSLGILSTASSNYLVVKDFGFSIPAGSVISGIVAEIERSAGGLGLGASITDNSVKIVKGNTITGAEHASASAWPSLNAYASYGSNTDNWGTTWTVDDINSSGFGVAVSCKLSTGLLSLLLTGQIDHIRIKVYYNTPSVPVPVRFQSFTAVAESSKINLQWSTSYELNNHYFVAEKQIDNSGGWRSVDTIMAKDTGLALNSYRAVDHFPSLKNIYRIKQVDQDNSSRYSETVMVTLTDPQPAPALVYPNPVSGTLYAETKTAMTGVSMTDNFGKELFYLPATGNQYHIDVSGFKAGIYFLRIHSKEGTVVERVVKR